MMPPLRYDYQNALYSSMSPSQLHVSNTALTQFFARYLWQDIYSVIKWTIPDNWNEGYFNFCLYQIGTCAVINTDKFGVIPQQCGLGGLTVQYQPAYVLISNPLLRTDIKLTIGTNCGLLHPCADYMGLGDIVGYYADLMAITAESLGMNTWNSKLSYILAANNKAASKSLQTVYDKISEGNPAVAVDEQLINKATGRPNWFPFDTNVGGNYIGDKLVILLNNLFDMFHTDIGIPNANTDKRERLISDEVNANNIETSAKTDTMIDRLKKQIEETKRIFGNINLDCEWRFNNAAQYKPNSDIQPLR